MDRSFLDRYFDSSFRVPGVVLQPMLDWYMELYFHWDRLRGKMTTTEPAPSEEIAEASRELMETHYDMPLVLFENFLDGAMKYSMGLWEKGAGNLDEAQQDMLTDVCEKADIRDGQRILDIGCGFGSLAAHVLQRFPNAKVWGLTLSRTQADYMRAKQQEAGHPLNTDRFYLIEDDFNNVRFDQPFDRVLSLGVFEHISNMGKALERVRTFLHREGKLFLHYIVYRPYLDGVAPARQNDFIARYIFPGGRIWSEREIFGHQEHFTVERNWFLNGSNYRRTIEAWVANFLRNYDRIARESGLGRRRLKIWEVYLRACISVFKVYRGRHYGNGQYLLGLANGKADT